MVIFLKNACYDVLKKQKKIQILEVYGVFNIIPVLDQTALRGINLPFKENIPSVCPAYGEGEQFSYVKLNC